MTSCLLISAYLKLFCSLWEPNDGHGCEAGIKKALERSSAYPYEFGVAIAAIILRGGERCPPSKFNVGTYEGKDHLGSLNDLLKNRAKTWWRQLCVK